MARDHDPNPETEAPPGSSRSIKIGALVGPATGRAVIIEVGGALARMMAGFFGGSSESGIRSMGCVTGSPPVCIRTPALVEGDNLTEWTCRYGEFVVGSPR